MTLDESSIIQHRYSDGTFMMDVWTVIDGHQCPTINAVLIKLTVDIEARVSASGRGAAEYRIRAFIWYH